MYVSCCCNAVLLICNVLLKRAFLRLQLDRIRNYACYCSFIWCATGEQVMITSVARTPKHSAAARTACAARVGEWTALAIVRAMDAFITSAERACAHDIRNAAKVASRAGRTAGVGAAAVRVSPIRSERMFAGALRPGDDVDAPAQNQAAGGVSVRAAARLGEPAPLRAARAQRVAIGRLPLCLGCPRPRWRPR